MNKEIYGVLQNKLLDQTQILQRNQEEMRRKEAT